MKPAPVKPLFRFFGWNAERDAAIEGNGVKLDVEAIAVFVRPCRPDAGEVSLSPLPSRT